jgi:hypothetical protein
MGGRSASPVLIASQVEPQIAQSANQAAMMESEGGDIFPKSALFTT